MSNPLLLLLHDSLPACWHIRAARFVSFRFVSFFVSEDKPTVRSRRSRRPTAYTRTRQLLRTTRHIVYASRSLSLSLSLLARGSHVRAPSPSRRPSRFLSFSRARGRLAYDICGEVQSGGSFQVATKCVSRRPSALLRVKKIRFEFYFPFLSFVFFFLRNGSLFRVDRVKK